MSSSVDQEQERAESQLAEEDSEGPRFVELVELLSRKREWIGKSTLIGLIVTTIIAVLIPNQYESTAQLMPPESQSMSGTAMIAAMTGVSVPSPAMAGLASSIIGAKSPGAVFVGILRSRTVQDRLIDQFDLRKVYWRKRYVDTRKKLAARTTIEENKNGIITITVMDRDPRRAQQLAGAYITELDKLTNQLSTSSARRERIFLEQRLAGVKHDLDEASRKLSQFSSRNATLDVQNQAKAMIEAAAKLQGELIAAESELSGLQAIYTDNNVRVRSVRARIAELRQQLRQLSGVDENVNGEDLDSTQLYPSLRKLPLLGVTYYDLYRQAMIQESIFGILTKQYEIAKVQEAKEIPTIKVLDAPDIPEKKSFPPRLLIISLGALLTFFGSSYWVYKYHSWEISDPSAPTRIMLESFAVTAKTDFLKVMRRFSRRTTDSAS